MYDMVIGPITVASTVYLAILSCIVKFEFYWVGVNEKLTI